MDLNIARSRGQRTRFSDQRIVSEDVFSIVSNRLRQHSCVAFALACGLSVDWSPELDIAVRLLSIARYGRPVDHGHLIWGLEPHWVTPAATESGLEAVAACITLLKQSAQPFEFVAHVEGQLSAEVHCGPGDELPRLRQLADAVANEVGSLSG